MTGALRTVRNAELIWVPWKNGGGLAADIAVSPPHAGWSDFDWRVSTARVERAAAFSHFPACERGMVLLEGHRLRLDFGSGRPEMTVDGPPAVRAVRFAGDVAVTGRPDGGPIVNLNVMVHRHRADFDLLVGDATDLAAAPLPAGATRVLLVRQGRVQLPGGGVLSRGDAVTATAPVPVRASPETQVVAITVWSQPHSPSAGN
jgi:hypothetical protein